MNKQKFINYKSNKYLYTDDNWKTVLITPDENSPSCPPYKKETNKNRALEAKLKYEYGYKAASFIIGKLKEIGRVRENKTGQKFNKNAGYGDEFEILAISVLHNLSYEEIIDKNIVVGDGDGKIDAICLNKAGQCCIYQIKMDVITDDYLKLMQEHIDAYIKGKLQSIPNCSDLKTFLDSNYPDLSHKRIVFKTVSENSKLPSNIKSSEIFNMLLRQEFLLSAENKTLTIELESSTSDIQTFAITKDGKIIFTFVNAEKLIESIINCYTEKDFEHAFSNNVRGDTGEDEGMVKTISNYPKNFCAFNNGISITGKCTLDKESVSYFVTVENSNIINGQQTIWNLFNCYKKGTKIDSVSVPLFIKQCDSESIQSQIAKFNNTQKNVTSLDLLSLDSNVRSIQRSLLCPDVKKGAQSYYLDILSSGEKNNVNFAKKIFSKEVIKLSDFVKLYSVIQKPESLGVWKNNLNKQIKDNYSENFPQCPIDMARKICRCILDSKAIISLDRSSYALADLAIQYLLYLGLEKESVKSIIDKTTNQYKNKVKRTADIYKSSSAYSRVLANVPKNIAKTFSA